MCPGFAVMNGQGGNRTPDTRIFSPLLYQLSYLAERGKLMTLKHARQPFAQPQFEGRFPTRAVTMDLMPPRVLKSPTTSIHRG